MIRRIVLLKNREWLSEAWQKRSFAPAAANLDRQVKVSGVQFHTLHPIPAFTRYAVGATTAAAKYGTPIARHDAAHEGYTVVGMFDSQEDVERLKRDRPDQVVGVFVDPRIEASPTAVCASRAIGDFRDVRRALGVDLLARKKITGKGVRIVIVDTGITGSHPGPDGALLQKSLDTTRTYPAGYKPGTAKLDHGTMVAFDTLIGAPDAKLLDYALMQAGASPWSAFLSDALAIFADLMDLLRTQPGPLVVNNSWAMFDTADDAPVGSPENYGANPDHPFNHIVGALVNAGADVLFAAGNCGAECPDGRCGMHDVGPGNSIHGANSHPSVITVAAVTTKKTRLGYSSQGPGGLSARKPDVAAYSQFTGSGVYEADAGTSAASPVAAGVVAALRQAWPTMPAAELKGIIQRSADPVAGSWSYDLGYGILSAGRAWSTNAAKPKQPVQHRARPKKPSSARRAWMLVPSTPRELQTHVAALKKRRPGR